MGTKRTPQPAAAPEADAPKVNKRYKDTVFTLLFGEKKERLLDLYGALHGTACAPETKIVTNTLKGALFMNRRNDLSFTVGGRTVVLVEHQSTPNGNMPLRFLEYAVRLYGKGVKPRAVYRSRLQELPKPEFIVLYNGKAQMPERDEMKLSSAFMGLEADETPALELKVQMYNINKGYNVDIVGRSRDLSDYVEFIATARSNQASGMPLGGAVREAVRDCIGRGVLEEFLRNHGSEVASMLQQEWKLEEALEVSREEGVALGIEQGIERGIEQGIEQGIERGIEQGIEQGVAQERLAIARNALRMGMSRKEISRLTGLSLGEIEGVRRTPASA
jgi:hypothetical protein